MILRSLTGENFSLVQQMPQMHWKGYYVLYDHTLSDERRLAMLTMLEHQLIHPAGVRLPPIQRIELHAAEASAHTCGYVVVVFDKMTKVFAYQDGEL